MVRVANAAPPDPASVYAWFKGDDGLAVASDNYAVTNWVNQGTAVTNATSTKSSRDLINLTGAPQKLYLSKSDGTPVGAIRFDGNDGIWAAKSAFGILPSNQTFVVCARVLDGFNQGFLFDATSYSPGLTRVQVRSNTWQVSTSGSTSTSFGPAAGTSTSAVATNVWQVHSFIVATNGGVPKFQHFIDGAQVGNVTLATNGSLSGLMIGANASQQYGIRADVAEFMVFNAALDTAARAAVEDYLSNKWTGVSAETNAPPAPAARLALFTAGLEGYACYRIPAMVTTTQGTLIAVADGRISDCGDIPNPLDLVAKRSYDNGRTWTPLQVIADYGKNASDTDTYPYYGVTNIARVAGGDAALLVDHTNGRIWVLYDNGAYAAGKPNNRAIKLELRYSDDNGTNWSPRIDIEAENPGLRPAAAQFLAGPGNGIQLAGGPHAGRLIFPAYAYGGPYYSTVIFSDDHGQTWRLGGNAGTGGGEIQVAETVNGGLIASIRNNTLSTTGVRYFSTSTDGGETWGPLFYQIANPPTLPDPKCQGNILRLTTTNDSNASRMVHANAGDPSSRVKMTLRLSYDDGQTWPVSNLVYSGSSAYSSIAKLATGDIGLLFESDNYTRIDYLSRSISEISGGADSLPPYTVWAGTQFTPVQLADPRISGPAADPDGDGLNNEAEFKAGTNPLDPASNLRLRIKPAATNATSLNFDAVSNKSYTVQFRDATSTNLWERYVNISSRPTNGGIEVPVFVTNATRFFRLVTPQVL